MFGRKKPMKGWTHPVKKKKIKGPRKINGCWQEGNPEDGIDIFEWFTAEDLVDAPDAAVTDMREVGAFSVDRDRVRKPYDVPQYRTPPLWTSMYKMAKRSPPPDQSLESDFIEDFSAEFEYFADESETLADADVITSFEGLRMLLAFAEEAFQYDMAAKGRNTAHGQFGVHLDFLRILRFPQAPNAIGIASLWHWCPDNQSMNAGETSVTSWLPALERSVAGGKVLNPRFIDNSFLQEQHFRFLKFELGGLKFVVKVPIIAVMPSQDDEAMDHPGQGVLCDVVPRKDPDRIYGRSMHSRYCLMQLNDSGMFVCATHQAGEFSEVKELTREDMRLDQPELEEESGRLLGRLAELIRRIKDKADAPGCRAQSALYVNYHDNELRLISPKAFNGYSYRGRGSWCPVGMDPRRDIQPTRGERELVSEELVPEAA